MAETTAIEIVQNGGSYQEAYVVHTQLWYENGK